jgi:sugar porter (SP) family MFS transporter
MWVECNYLRRQFIHIEEYHIRPYRFDHNWTIPLLIHSDPLKRVLHYGPYVEEAGGLCWVRHASYPGRAVRSFWWCVIWVRTSKACTTIVLTDMYRYDTGTIGGILGMNYWRQTFSTGFINKTDNMLDVTAEQTSLIVSILSAGTFFGALTAAPTADFLGRRLGLVASNVIFCVGVILQTAATDIPLFVAGRFFAGFGVGMISATIPLYQSETAPKWIRGVIVGAYQLAITIGLLLAAIVNNATKNRNDTGSYRIPIAVQFAWAIILFVGCIFLPETPRWYIKKGRPENAAKSLSKLRRLDIEHPAVVEELAEITANHEYELSLGKATYLDCFKGNLGKRLATGCLLQALQQLTGVNFICKYDSCCHLVGSNIRQSTMVLPSSRTRVLRTLLS